MLIFTCSAPATLGYLAAALHPATQQESREKGLYPEYFKARYGTRGEKIILAKKITEIDPLLSR